MTRKPSNPNVLFHSVLAVVGTALVWQILLMQALRLLHGEVTTVHTVTIMSLGSVITGLMFLTLVSSMRGTPKASDKAKGADKDHCEQDVRHADHDCVVALTRDSWGLSRAETEVALFAIKGFSNREIAELRGSEIATVKKQLSSVYRKSELENRFQLMAFVNDEMLQASHADQTSAEVVNSNTDCEEAAKSEPRARVFA